MVEARARDGLAIEGPLPRTSGRAGGGLRFTTIGSEAADALRQGWTRLATRCAGDNVFLQPDFTVPAMRQLGGRAVSIAVVSESGGNVVGVAPFTRARLGRIAPAISVWTHPYAPLGLPLIASDRIEDTVAVMVDGLAPRGAGVSLILPDLPLDGPIAHALRRLADMSGRPALVLGGHVRAVLGRPVEGPSDLRRQLPTRRRKEYARQMRRLGEHGLVTIEAARAPDDVRVAFEGFLQLEAAGWKGRSGTALISRSATAAFARAAVSGLAQAGAARVHSIRIDGRPIAALVSLLAGATAFTWKIAYDETYALFSPGAQLMMEAANDLFLEAGVRRLDSCASADHPMIDHLWPGRIRIGMLVLGPPGGGAVHSLGVEAAKAEMVARACARRLRERFS